MGVPAGQAAVFFDVDGVLIDSVRLKGELFARAFSDFPEYRDRILALHLEHGGKPREDKIRMIYKEVVGKDIGQVDLRRRMHIFSSESLQQVSAAPEITGANKALTQLSTWLPLHAISATPQNELEKILRFRGNLHCFRSVHGVSQKKDRIIFQLLSQHNYRTDLCLFVGDSQSDADAAAANNVRFVQVTSSGTGRVLPAVSRVPNLQGLDSLVISLLKDAKG